MRLIFTTVITIFAFASGEATYAGPSNSIKYIEDGRLDGRKFEPESKGFMQCVLSGTYDPNVWDKNRYIGQKRDNEDERFKKNDGSSATQVEIVQWSWAERARCQQSLGTADANLTGALGVSYILAADAHSDNVKRVSNNQLKVLGYLVLLPVVLDDLRAIGPTRRYYTSAVLGTSLISWRNKALKDAFNNLSRLSPDHAGVTTPNCFLQPPSTFALKNSDVPGIESLQAKVILDVEAYNDWCKVFRTTRTKVWALNAQKDYISDAFEDQRTVKWQQYATLINNNGYSQQATTAHVLHKIITLPVTLVSTLVGSGPTEYQLDDHAKMNGADAVELPVLGGNFSISATDTDLPAISQSLQGHLSDLETATKTYSPSEKKDEKAVQQKKLESDKQTIGKLTASGYFNNAAQIGAYWYQVKSLVSEINALNAKRYIILEVGSGTAYLSDTSLAQVKASTPSIPAPAVADAPAKP